LLVARVVGTGAQGGFQMAIGHCRACCQLCCAALDFVGHWQRRAAQLAAGPTVTYGHLKTALRASFDNTLEQQLSLEAKLQGKCGQTRDFQEGVVAFLEKRPAAFEGR